MKCLSLIRSIPLNHPLNLYRNHLTSLLLPILPIWNTRVFSGRLRIIIPSWKQNEAHFAVSCLQWFRKQILRKGRFCCVRYWISQMRICHIHGCISMVFPLAGLFLWQIGYSDTSWMKRKGSGFGLFWVCFCISVLDVPSLSCCIWAGIAFPFSHRIVIQCVDGVWLYHCWSIRMRYFHLPISLRQDGGSAHWHAERGHGGP